MTLRILENVYKRRMREQHGEGVYPYRSAPLCLGDGGKKNGAGMQRKEERWVPAAR
jgi:hypothetical protein